MLEVRSIEDLVAVIEGREVLPRAITIDGAPGAGKTTMGASLAQKLCVQHLDLDWFLERDQDVFVDALRVEEFLRVSALYQRMVISGVCIVEVLDRLKIKDAFKVYLKRVDAGKWADEEELYGNFLEEAESLGAASGALRYEVRGYHRHVRPDENADVIFCRGGPG